MLGWCLASVVDDGSTSAQHWTNASCFSGCPHIRRRTSQQIGYVEPMLGWSCASVEDDGHHWHSIGFIVCCLPSDDPVNTRLWHNVVLMLGQRRRLWANVKPTLCLLGTIWKGVLPQKIFDSIVARNSEVLGSVDVRFWRQMSIPAL